MRRQGRCNKKTNSQRLGYDRHRSLGPMPKPWVTESAQGCFHCHNLSVLPCINFSRAALTKPHRLSSINNKNVLSQGSGGWKSKRSMSANSVSGKSSLPGLQTAKSPVSLHGGGKRESTLVSVLTSTPVPAKERPTLTISVNLNCLYSDPIFCVHWGVGLQCSNSERTQFRLLQPQSLSSYS